MCGLAGEFLFGRGRADIDMVRRMAQRLTHRGPDEAGEFLSAEGRCAMATRRLAVIDPAGSHQPMTSGDGQVSVSFNGAIYNFRQLRDELRADGASFQTAGDTEVLLHLYQRFGVAMLDKLDGMFAIAVYDAGEGTLTLARDRLGQKPLWYAFGPDRVMFASEVKALLTHEEVSSQMRRISVSAYITMGYMPQPETIYADILKLPPGNVLTISDAPVRPERYWRARAIDVPESPADQIDMVRKELQRSVAARLVSDVPLGALLSGGIDSSIVVALMSEAAGEAGGVRTFTAGIEDPAYDERPAASLVAKHCRTDHTELLVRCDPAGAIDRIVDMYDEPFADSSALPTYLICQAAREHVTVALAGDGGDEVFGGYDRYRALQIADTAGPMKYALIRLAASLIRPMAAGRGERNRLRRFVRLADAIPLPPSLQYFKYRSLFDAEDLAFLFTDEFGGAMELDAPAEWFCDLYEEPDVDDEVVRAQRHDIATYLPDDLLVKADIASMANGLELRAPMLDHHVVQLGLSLPVEAKISGRCGKSILRKAFCDILPPEILKRPKLGFGVPLARWLREDLRDQMCDTLLDDSLTARGILRKEALAGLINDHLSRKRDHSHRLWALMVLARWLSRQES
jgi:asparagine synthase (glutamine-hydrolysing)